ncbi:MAG: JAB domain-containing protein [Pseudomonadota bacterium]
MVETLVKALHASGHPTPFRQFLDSEARMQVSYERMLARMIKDLRAIILAPPASCERFHAVFLDKDRVILGQAAMGYGHASGLCLRPRELFSRALALEAAGIIIAHNHPSGDCRPSLNDVRATTRIADIANSLEIQLVDHLIFTHRATYSMRAGGEL